MEMFSVADVYASEKSSDILEVNTKMTICELHKKAFGKIESEHLVLRPLTMEDAEDMFDYTCREESFRFLRGNAHKSVEEDRIFLSKVLNSYEKNDDFVWGICRHNDNRVIGTCRIFDINLMDQRCEISYLVNPAYQGCGIATEVVSTLIRYAFYTLGFHRIQARCVVENVGSERVMQKVGMEMEGLMRSFAKIHGVYQDYKIYAVIRGN